MKYIIVLFAVFSMNFISVAQDYKMLKSGSHLTNSNLDQFVGTWKSQNEKFELKLVIEKVGMPIGDATIDGLIGHHVLKVDHLIKSKSESSSSDDNIKSSTLSARVADGSDKFQGYFVLDKNSTKYKVVGQIAADRQELTISFTSVAPDGIRINEEKTVDVLKLPSSIKFYKHKKGN